MELRKRILLLLQVFAYFNFGQAQAQGPESRNLLEPYEAEVEASRAAEASAHADFGAALERWSSDAVSLLAEYRTRAQRAKELALTENSEPEEDCNKDIPGGVEEATTLYIASETPCMTTANSAIKYSRSRLKAALKEVRRWRRGLYFMSRACRKDFPEDIVAAARCLSRQVNSERYNQSITWLILNLREVQKEFVPVVNAAHLQLKECVESSLGAFSESIGRVLENATLCRATKGGQGNSSERPMEIRISSNATRVHKIRRLNIKCLNITN